MPYLTLFKLQILFLEGKTYLVRNVCLNKVKTIHPKCGDWCQTVSMSYPPIFCSLTHPTTTLHKTAEKVVFDLI